MRNDNLWLATLDHFRTPGAFRKSTHASRMGLKRPFYMDFDHFVHDPVQCEEIVRLIAENIGQIMVSRPVHAIAFIEKADGGTTGAITLAGAISILVRLPNLVVRLWKDIPSERVKLPPIRGQSPSDRLAGMNVVIVADHSTTGDEVLRAVRAIGHFGCDVSDVIVYTSLDKDFKRDAFGNTRVHLIHKLPGELAAAGIEL